MCEIVEALDEFQKVTRIDLSYAYGNVSWTVVRRKLLERNNDFSSVYICSRAPVSVQELCIERALFPFPTCVVENMPRRGINYENLWLPIMGILEKAQGDVKRVFFVEQKSQALIKQIFPKLASKFIVLKDISMLKPKKAKPVEI